MSNFNTNYLTMKKLLIMLSGLFLAFGINAQDYEKDLKKAARLVGTYNLDPSSNADKLVEAQNLIDGVIGSGQLDESSKAWITQAKVYNELMNKDVQTLALNQSAEVSSPDAPEKAFEGFMNALKYAVKGYEKKDALKGIRGVLSNVSYLGSVAYQKQNYKKAYLRFKASIDGSNALKEAGEAPYFPSDSLLQEQMYFTGIAAMTGNMMDEAKGVFEELYQLNYSNPAVFEALYKVNKDNDPATAEKFLNEGRTKFPDDVGLLYTMINLKLTQGKLGDLIGDLELALEKEPTNKTVKVTLGNVYDQLYQKAAADGDEATAQGHFDNALKYFNAALEDDPNYFDAIYSIGALYYNKAAALTVIMNSLADDYSKEGTKKYEDAKAAADEMFGKALPFFQKADGVNSKDVNTLIALKEIHARNNEFEKVEEYKARLDALGEGE